MHRRNRTVLRILLILVCFVVISVISLINDLNLVAAWASIVGLVLTIVQYLLAPRVTSDKSSSNITIKQKSGGISLRGNSKQNQRMKEKANQDQTQKWFFVKGDITQEQTDE